MAPIITHHPFNLDPLNISTLHPCSVDFSSPPCHRPHSLLPRDNSSNATQTNGDYERANLNAVLCYLATLAVYFSILTFIFFVIAERCRCNGRRAQHRPQHHRVWPAAPDYTTENRAGNAVELQQISGLIAVERVVEVQAPKLAALRGEGRRDGEGEEGETLPVYVEGERSGSESEAAPSYTEVEDRDPAAEAR